MSKTEETQKFQSDGKLIALEVHAILSAAANYFARPFRKFFESASTAYMQAEMERGKVIPFRDVFKTIV